MVDLTGARLAGGLNANREVNDFYATPESDVHKFLDESGLVPNQGLVLEPSAGLGHMVRPIQEKRPNATVLAGDMVQRDFPLDYVNDFLALDATYMRSLGIGCVITNPPFKHAQAFVEHALSFCDGDVIMLMKLAFLEGKARRPLYERKTLREVWVSTSRINCVRPEHLAAMEHGVKPPSSVMAMAWFVFNNTPTDNPILKWI